MLLAFAGIGVLFVALGVPLALGKVPPNPFYGFRVPKTLSSPQIWYPANKVTGVDFILCGSVLAAASLCLHFYAAELGELYAVSIALGVMLLGLALTVAHGFHFLRSL